MEQIRLDAPFSPDHVLLSGSRSARTAFSPLSHIRAFEATVRHGSVTKAAKELNIATSSVSRHNRLLQESLGVPLFRSVEAGISVTERGRVFAEGVACALNVLESTAQKVTEPAFERSLRVVCPGVFLKRWLVPRLYRFLNRNLDVQMHASQLVPGGHDRTVETPTHLMLSFERIHPDSEALCPDPVLPLVSPALFEQIRRAGRGETMRLLCDHSEKEGGWANWFALLPELQALHTTKFHFDEPDAALEAALMGHGAVLARQSVARSLLKEGRLMRLNTRRSGSETFLWHTKPAIRSLNPPERRFLSWLKAEIA